ncbi:MAG TPA: ABC transporter ATP-binding protein [Anaerolineales bacterium]|nr:ABC transporter ATP-binding protein [Anaerolineales bacterium]
MERVLTEGEGVQGESDRPSYIIELSDVSKRFGEVLALDHVTLRIRDGEFFSMLGPSGCGKTTSLRLMAGFEFPSEGEVRIAGAVQGTRPPFQRPVNTVFQSYALFPHMTVFQNTAFGLEMQHVPKDEIRRRVAKALELVQLPGKESRKPKQLSGGQQQRVALARALVNGPDVLLLDEPLGALDLKLRKAMQFELKALQNRLGLTFVYVTHDQEEALTMSDRIAVMDGGHVLQVGTPAEIYENPANRFVADFIGETNFLLGQIHSRARGLVQVESDGLALWAPAGEDVPASGTATVAIRPEKIILGRTKGPGRNSFEGAIEVITYVGKDSDFRVRLTPQATIRVRVQNQAAGAAAVFAVGDRVWVSWPEEAARVLLD